LRQDGATVKKAVCELDIPSDLFQMRRSGPYEGAKFWMRVMNEMKNRGGLSGFPCMAWAVEHL
jgi:hypothetical protein